MSRTSESDVLAFRFAELSLAVLRTSSLAGLLAMVPALRAIRCAFPNSRIALAGSACARGFVERFPHLLDQHILYSGFPGLAPAAPRAVLRFLSECHSRAFDLLFQFDGPSAHSNDLGAMMGAKRSCGFYRRGEWCPEPPQFVEWLDSESEIAAPLRVLEKLGVGARGEELEFPIRGPDYDDLRSLLHEKSLKPGGYVCIDPGVGRFWAPEKLAALLSGVRASRSKPVLIGQPGSVRAILSGDGKRGAVEMEDLGLGLLGALIKLSRGVIAGNDDTAYLAAAVGVPSVRSGSSSGALGTFGLDHRLHRRIQDLDRATPAEAVAELESAQEQLMAIGTTSAVSEDQPGNSESIGAFLGGRWLRSRAT